MKLILARIVYNFDLELVDKEAKWNEQDVFVLWRKGPLMVQAKERV
jgi:hypothetical protein